MKVTTRARMWADSGSVALPPPVYVPPPPPNVSVCANVGRRVTVSGCV